MSKSVFIDVVPVNDPPYFSLSPPEVITWGLIVYFNALLFHVPATSCRDTLLDFSWLYRHLTGARTSRNCTSTIMAANSPFYLRTPSRLPSKNRQSSGT